MKYADFKKKLLSTLLDSYLASVNFSVNKNDELIRVKQSGEINILSLQKHSTKSLIAVNLGVHYDFIPTSSGHDFSSTAELEFIDCELKLRLTPDSDEVDYWWPLESKSIAEIENITIKNINQLLNKYDLDNKLNKLTAEAVKEQIPADFSSIPAAKFCLLLGLLNERNGNITDSLQFAELGMSKVGMAVSIKKRLKQLIKKLNC